MKVAKDFTKETHSNFVSKSQVEAEERERRAQELAEANRQQEAERRQREVQRRAELDAKARELASKRAEISKNCQVTNGRGRRDYG